MCREAQNGPVHYGMTEAGTLVKWSKTSLTQRGRDGSTRDAGLGLVEELVWEPRGPPDHHPHCLPWPSGLLSPSAP